MYVYRFKAYIYIYIYAYMHAYVMQLHIAYVAEQPESSKLPHWAQTSKPITPANLGEHRNKRVHFVGPQRII